MLRAELAVLVLGLVFSGPLARLSCTSVAREAQAAMHAHPFELTSSAARPSPVRSVDGEAISGRVWLCAKGPLEPLGTSVRGLVVADPRAPFQYRLSEHGLAPSDPDPSYCSVDVDPLTPPPRAT